LPDEDAVADRKLSFWRYFTLAYEDAARVLRGMFPVVLTVVAAVVVLGFLGRLIDGYIPTRLGQSVLDLLVAAGTAYVISPYLIVLYRAVATNDMTLRAESLRGTREAQRFAAWSVLSAFIIAAPELLFAVFGPDVPPEQITEENVNTGAMLMIFAITVGVWIFSVRAATLMPLLALDPDRAGLPVAFAQSKGHFWYIVGVLVVTMLPVLIGGVIVAALIGGLFGVLAPILMVPVGAAITGVTLVTAIAVSTRLYQRFAE
jgi:hypothetical protein